MSLSRKATFVCGTELTAHRQAQCLAHYTDRYTGDHKPAWAQRTEVAPVLHTAWRLG